MNTRVLRKDPCFFLKWKSGAIAAIFPPKRLPEYCTGRYTQ